MAACPLVGDLEVRGAKNLVSKAMVAALLAEGPCRLRDVPEIRDVKIVRGCCELHGVKIDSTRPRRASCCSTPRNVEQAHVADIDAHAGSSPHPDPPLRPAAAPAGRGVHPRPRRLPHRRAGRSTTTSTCCASSAPTSRSGPRACTCTPRSGCRHQDRAAVPVRRRHRAGAADRGARRGRHRAAQRGRRARDHGPHRRAAEDGRDHLRRHRPRRSGSTGVDRLGGYDHRAHPGPHRGGAPGRARRWRPRATSTSAAPSSRR